MPDISLQNHKRRRKDQPADPLAPREGFKRRALDLTKDAAPTPVDVADSSTSVLNADEVDMLWRNAVLQLR